jgi:hypothetical protein
MRFLLLSSLAIGGAFLFPPRFYGNQQPAAQLVAEDNINSRYTVESVELGGDDDQPKLPPSLRERLTSLVGVRFDPAQFDELAREIRDQLHLRSVKPHILRGTTPETVRVLLETERRSVEFDVSVPRFFYNSVQGWSAQAQASTTIARTNVIRIGVVSDGDQLTERFTGFDGAYQNLDVGSNRIHFAFLVQGLHEQWSRATQNADGAAKADLYRSRRNFQPELVFLISRSLALTLGVSLEQMEMENPALRDESADAIIAGLQYSRKFESGGPTQEEIAAAYDLRVASKALAGDFGYARHRATVAYTVKSGRNTISDEVLAGSISGRAPLFERFVLGTSSLLRGWDRYEIDPLGGNRVLHNSVDYSYRIDPGSIQVFYDAGILWNQSQSAPLRHSIGFGYRQSVFSLALAFPIRSGRVEPVLMVGMNY